MYNEENSAAYWNTRAQSFDQQYDALDIRKEVTRRIVELLNPTAGDRCIDLGVGTARMFRDYRSLFGACESLVGVDFSPRMLDIAVRQCKIAGLAHFRAVQSTFASVPLPNAQADCISSSLALHHVPDHAKRMALQEACRLGRGRCRIVIADQMNCTGRQLNEEEFRRLMLDTFFPGSNEARTAKSSSGHQEYSCTIEEMQQLFRDVGLKPAAEKVTEVIGIVHAELPS